MSSDALKNAKTAMDVLMTEVRKGSANDNQAIIATATTANTFALIAIAERLDKVIEHLEHLEK